MNTALLDVAQRLRQLPDAWLVGGSCGLVLQHIALPAPPRDLDIYVEESAVDHIAALLNDAVIMPPHHSETGIYRSRLSHFRIHGVKIEVVGGFQIANSGSLYRVEVNDLLALHSSHYVAQGMTIALMPLAHELIFNVLRNRPDRYELIAAAMRKQGDEHVLLHQLLARNTFSLEHQEIIHEVMR